MKHLLATVALLAVTACAQTAGTNSFTQEAGAVADTGSFGNATMNNMLVMSGQRDFSIALARRFAAEVPTMVNFAFDSTVLDAEAQRVLREQANFIRQFPEVRFKVYGHTDLVGSNAYNRSLGLRRAQTVVSFLTSQGISRSRLEAVVSLGETQPLVVTEGREERNRRTVTEVSGFVQRHPGVLNGKYAQVIFREYVNSAQRAPTVGSQLDGITEG